MSTQQPTNKGIPRKYSLLLLFVLIVAGLAGNYFHFPVFLNIDFLFGSIFAMLALQLFGPGLGIPVAAVIAGYTYALWNHPYAIIILIAEAAVVCRLMGRRKIGMVLADTLYWLVVGIPLIYLFYHFVMHVPLGNIYIIMVKQAVNGIANALAARLLFTTYGYYTRSSPTSYREIINNLLAFFVLCPALIILGVSSRADFAEIDAEIRTMLRKDSQLMDQRLDAWVEDRKYAILNVAELAATKTARQMQPHLEQTKRSDNNFLRVGVLDKEATVTAYFPLLDELGVSAIGKNFADRLFLPELKRTLRPTLSEVVMGKMGPPRPVVVMLAPVVIRGEYGGYVTGTLNLAQIREYLDKSVERHASLYTLIDKNSNIIMTNRTDQVVMTPFKRGDATLNQLETGVSRWVPTLPANTPVSEQWKKSFYVVESPIGSIAEWRLILEQPVAPFQKKLYDNYAGKLTLLFLLLLVALASAELLSRRIMASLDKLRQMSSNLPSQLASGTIIDWPSSGISETNSLITNFQEMSNSIHQYVVDLELLNYSLESRVEERTNQLFEALHELDIILENAPIGISKVIDRKQVLVNRKVLDIFQYSKEEALFQPIRNIYPSDEAYEKLGLDASPVLAEGLVFETVQELVRKDGAHIQIRYIGKAIAPLDLSKGIIWLLEDVTEKMQVEKSLRASEQKLMEASQFSEQVIISVQEGVIVFDLNSRYRVWNPFMEQITGLPAGEVIGRHPSELFPFPHASAVIEGLEKVLAGAASVKTDFPYSVPKTGRSGWVSDQISPLRNMKGEVIGAISTVREITLRKQMDSELRQALEATTTVNATMKRLLTTVAHEFRTPLGLLAGSTDILDRYWDRMTPEERFEQNEHIRNAAHQLAILVNSVMSFNQLGADTPPNPLQIQNVGKACHAIAGEVEAVWGSGQEFIVSIMADCGAVLLDKSLFRRILENLLTNAFRYTPADGTVSLHVSRVENRLFLAISDTGIGIPDDDQKLIFDAFYRCKNVEGRRGLGLGLSIVYEALTQLGGTITVSSRAGEGTIMRVEVPVEDHAKRDVLDR